MKKQDHLPVYGVGPIYVYVIAALAINRRCVKRSGPLCVFPGRG